MSYLGDCWQSLVNGVGFAIRQRLHFKKSGFDEFSDPFLFKTDAVEQNWDALGFNAVFEQLNSRYALGGLEKTMSRLRWLETLTYLHHLDWIQHQSNVLNKNTNQGQALNWLDVGCKNWGYVAGLVQFGQSLTGGQYCRLDGIELDAFRLYGNFHSRWDYAQTFIAPYSKPPYSQSERLSVNYLVGDVAKLKPDSQYDVISWFLPFVFQDPCLAWGLPLSEFKPVSLFHHLTTLLKPNGVLLIVSQGEDEYHEQQAILQTVIQGAGWLVEPLGSLPESFMSFQHTRYAIVCRKIAVSTNKRSVESGPLTHAPSSQHNDKQDQPNPDLCLR